LAAGFVAAQSITGVAFTTGTPLTTILDPALFTSSTPLGTVVTLTVTVNGTPLILKYTMQFGTATLTSTTPTSADFTNTTKPLVVTLTGANYVDQNSIVGNVLKGTHVFVGDGKAAWTDITTTNGIASTVVLRGDTMMVSILPTYFPAKAGPWLIGVANMTTTGMPIVPQASLPLNFTTGPVINAITSTASYIQPYPGTKPQIAPFELVSIFGANFGVNTATNTVPPNDPANGSGTLNSFVQYNTSVNATGTGIGTNKYVLLKVTFKSSDGKTSYSAPILFANATQINAIVPSLVTVTPNPVWNVFVTFGTVNSDNFPVTIVPSDAGIFTTSSAGIGQGAILNADYSVNSPATLASKAAVGSSVSIYMTGLGFPNSTGTDQASGTPMTYTAAGCVAVAGPKNGYLGYMDVVNLAIKANAGLGIAAYVPPSPAWTNIDGAVIGGNGKLLGGMPPCFPPSLNTITVTFGTGANAVAVSDPSLVTWAGFGSGSVAGLYSVNVVVPNVTGDAVPVKVSILNAAGTSTSQDTVVTMAIKP
jgi:uncharacterized protein (TIGR03437 family)